jgi:hypothetical protein
MNTKDHALDLALEALEESVDLVREDYENAKKLYSNYPSRQARLIGLEDGLSKHEAAITAIKQARSAPEEPVYHLRQFGDVTKEQLDRYMATGDINPQPAPVQPVALDVTLDGEEAKLLRDMLGDDRDELSPVRLLVGNGHSGHGLYAAHAEYQEEGAVLLAATPSAALVQEPDHGNELTIAYMSGLHDGKKKREWVGLTDEEIYKIDCLLITNITELVMAIEAKLKEKNT